MVAPKKGAATDGGASHAAPREDDLVAPTRLGADGPGSEERHNVVGVEVKVEVRDAVAKGYNAVVALEGLAVCKHDTARCCPIRRCVYTQRVDSHARSRRKSKCAKTHGDASPVELDEDNVKDDAEGVGKECKSTDSQCWRVEVDTRRRS